MDLVLIGLGDRLAGEIETEARARGLPEEVVSSFQDCGSVSTKVLSKATLVVLGRDQWDSWQETREEERPPVYLISEKKLTTQIIERVRELKAVGFAPDEAPELCTDVLDRYEFYRRSTEDIELELGDYLHLEGEGNVLVGWGIGPGATLRRSLQSIQDDLAPPALEEKPFQSVHPPEWLDKYTWYKYHVGFEPDPEREQDFWKRSGIRGEEQLLAKFESLFFAERDFVFRPILLLGETGTGKSIVAKKLHNTLVCKAGGRELPYHHVNCSALREMAEVELFGAMRGAYTSADRTNPGKVMASYGGTLFLDEFGTLDTAAQARLLLFLEDGTTTPMGWLGDPLQIPVQIIAATNEHLEDRVRRDEFRADLYHRFRDVLRLPPLRETKETDLPYMVDHFLQDETVNPNRRVRGVTREAMKKLRDHDYPGNARELQSVLARGTRKCREANVDSIQSSDILFDESTLPRQDGVVALIVKEAEGGEKEVMLLWNSHWKKYFLPSGRLEKGETAEACLVREIEEKMGVPRDSYTVQSIPGVGEISTIQYSVRDGKLKSYYFRPYVIRNGDLGANRTDVKWVPLTPSRWPRPLREEQISESLPVFEAAFDRIKERGSQPS